MILKESGNVDDIKSILCHPEIYDTISGDGCPLAEEFEPPINDEYKYIVGYVNDKPIAVMIYHKYLDGSICHVQVLPEYRKEYAKQFGEQSLLFGTRPLYAEIPELYKNVLEFAKNNGFKVIDTKVGDYTKRGITYNTKVLLWGL
jgi:hypothetical protein